VDGYGEDAPALLMTGTVFGGGVGAPIAGAPMKAQARLGLALSWRWISSAFLIDVAVLILASHLPGAPQTVAWWVVNRLTGRELAAVRASLPSPAKRPPLVVPMRDAARGRTTHTAGGSNRGGRGTTTLDAPGRGER